MLTTFRETYKVATIASLAIVAVLTLLMTALSFLGAALKLWHILVVDIVVFCVNFLIYQKIVDNYIYKKIKLIYKTIPSFKTETAQRTKHKATETLDKMNADVMVWGAKQRTEIDELKKLAAYRREFLGNISHELKTPIFNIQGYVLTLLDGGLHDPNINMNYLVRTEKSVNRLIAIVEDLEEISKLESGELKLNITDFNLAELAKDVAEFLDMKAGQNNAVITIENKAARAVMVTADKKRIRQVLINLIENAIKYGDKEKNKIQVRFFDMDENYLVEVKDNGQGIHEENLTRIFERFYRTDKGRSRDTGGTGLGLAIVKHIIEAHNHSIRARSKLGQSTIFSFTLTKALH